MDHGSMPWLGLRTLGLSVALCLVLADCGREATAPSALEPRPTAPSAPPTPTNTDASRSFLHVQQANVIVSYEIEADSGQLHPPVTQNLGHAQQLTGDPEGRRVYAAFPPNSSGEAGIAVYAPDREGMLNLLSQVSHQVGYSCFGPHPWVLLQASSTRLHVVSYDVTCSGHTHYLYQTHEISDDGQLGAGARSGFYFPVDDGWYPMVVDVGSNLLFRGSSDPYWYAPQGNSALASYSVSEPDGRLAVTGASNLCIASTVTRATPLVAAGGVLLASVRTDRGEETVCSWEGCRLAPRSNLGLRSDTAAAVTPAGGGPPLVAMSTSVQKTGRQEQFELRLFASDGHGGFEPLDAATTPALVTALAFHPSGRFLFASDRAEGLSVYAIASGKLSLVQSVDNSGGRMAVTVLAPAAATAPAPSS